MIGAISRKLIESIAYSDNAEYGEKIETTVFNLVSLALDDIGKSVPYVNVSNCVIQPINETFSHTYIPGGDFVYFLGIASPQLELNSITYSNLWKKIKHRFSEAWIQSSRRLRKKRERQIKAGALEEKSVEQSYEKYTLAHFLDDFQYSLTKNLLQTSIVYKSKDSVRIVGKDDFGVNTNIIIYPVILEGDDYKQFISRRKGYKIINFNRRAKCFNDRLEKIGPNYIFMMKVLNYLMKEITRQPSNIVLLESILYNCPEKFLNGEDIYDCFIKLINYLRFTDVSSYKSVLNKDKTIFDDEIIGLGASYQYSKFLKGFDRINLELIKRSE